MNGLGDHFFGWLLGGRPINLGAAFGSRLIREWPRGMAVRIRQAYKVGRCQDRATATRARYRKCEIVSMPRTARRYEVPDTTPSTTFSGHGWASSMRRMAASANQSNK